MESPATCLRLPSLREGHLPPPGDRLCQCTQAWRRVQHSVRRSSTRGFCVPGEGGEGAREWQRPDPENTVPERARFSPAEKHRSQTCLALRSLSAVG